MDQPPPTDGPLPNSFGHARLRGLPYTATEQDIVNFFVPLRLEPQDINIVTGPDGRATGEAFVRFQTEADADQALQKNRHHLGSRYLEIFRSTGTEFDRYSRNLSAGQAGGGFSQGFAAPPPVAEPQQAGVGGFLRCRGLPWSATYLDIVQFFSRQNVRAEDIIMGQTPDGRPSGEAWVQFETEASAESARQEMNKQSMGNRYIEIFMSNAAEMASGTGGQTGGHSNFAARGGGGGSMGGVQGVQSYQANPYPGESVIRMRGLPYTATETDIVQFFSGFQMLAVLPSTAPMNGRPSGEAYVEFSSPDEAQRAYIARNRATMGHRYLELFHSTKSEMMAAAAGQDPRSFH